MNKLHRVVLDARLLARAKAYAFAHSYVDRILPSLKSVCNAWKGKSVWRPDGSCGVISDDFNKSINSCFNDANVMLPVVDGCSSPTLICLYVINNISSEWVLRAVIDTCYDLDGIRESNLYKFNIAFLKGSQIPAEAGVLLDVCTDINAGWCPVVDGVLDEAALNDAVLNYNNLIDDLLRIDGLARKSFGDFVHLIKG